jgi:hypothetical protein
MFVVEAKLTKSEAISKNADQKPSRNSATSGTRAMARIRNYALFLKDVRSERPIPSRENSYILIVPSPYLFGCGTKPMNEGRRDYGST